jgi:3-deoxy-7-phosphoheptulonate synthase
VNQEDEAMLDLDQSGADAHRTVRIGSLIVGGARLCVIAGPCSVERDYVEHAEALASCGVDALRAGIYKPRTRPESFQGMGREALPMVKEARRRTGLPLVSEVLSIEDAEELGEQVDAFQVGARNMHNYRLLDSLGEIGRPVILKRGLAATIDEWVAASEYIRRRGNDDVVLCERGIRTFESRTRNTLDVSSVVVVRELTDLPVIVDPSHAAGNRALVPALASAALAAGADGLLIEAHPTPDLAWSDGDQTIDLDDCATIVAGARRATLVEARLARVEAAGAEERLAVIDAEMERLRALRHLVASQREALGTPI